MAIDQKYFGLVLVGGKSQRMGTSKAMIDYHGKPQAEHSCDLLRDICECVFLSLRPDQAETFAAFSVGKIYDAYLDVGPMGGILSAMGVHPDVSWIVLGCDLPFLTREGILNLVHHRRENCLAHAYRSAHDGLPEPLCAIYEPSAASSLKEDMVAGRRCLRKWFLNHSEVVNLIHLPEERMLDNINAPHEKQEALKRIQGQDASMLADNTNISVIVRYFAKLREERGLSQEALSISRVTVGELYADLKRKYALSLPSSMMRVAIHQEFVLWDRVLQEGDDVTLIPPVSGG